MAFPGGAPTSASATGVAGPSSGVQASANAPTGT